MSYWLSEAGATLRAQIDKRWPTRDKASDGWIGDASHAAVASDHNPCWTCSGDSYGVVRAIDVDSDLDRDHPEAAQRLANDLIECAREGKDDGRLSYVIYDRKIASGTYASSFWQWRAYTGSDPHTNHVHVSFTPKGDHRGRDFPLDVFGARRRRLKRIRAAIAALSRKIKALRKARAEKRDRLRGAR